MASHPLIFSQQDIYHFLVVIDEIFVFVFLAFRQGDELMQCRMGGAGGEIEIPGSIVPCRSPRKNRSPLDGS